MAQVKADIAQKFPQYTLSMRNPKILVVKKEGTSATMLSIQKGKITVIETFPTMGGQMLFIMIMILLGILIPYIVYMIAFQPGQKAVTKEVAAFVGSQYVQKKVVAKK